MVTLQIFAPGQFYPCRLAARSSAALVIGIISSSPQGIDYRLLRKRAGRTQADFLIPRCSSVSKWRLLSVHTRRCLRSGAIIDLQSMLGAPPPPCGRISVVALTHIEQSGQPADLPRSQSKKRNLPQARVRTRLSGGVFHKFGVIVPPGLAPSQPPPEDMRSRRS